MSFFIIAAAVCGVAADKNKDCNNCILLFEDGPALESAVHSASGLIVQPPTILEVAWDKYKDDLVMAVVQVTTLRKEVLAADDVQIVMGSFLWIIQGGMFTIQLAFPRLESTRSLTCSQFTSVLFQKAVLCATLVFRGIWCSLCLARFSLSSTKRSCL